MRRHIRGATFADRKGAQSFEKLSGRWMRRVLFPPAVNATPTRQSAIQRSVSRAWEIRRAIPRINYAGANIWLPLRPTVSRLAPHQEGRSVALHRPTSESRKADVHHGRAQFISTIAARYSIRRSERERLLSHLAKRKDLIECFG